MMDKTVVILQPGYLPWLGFFEQLYRGDIFVIYDDVQYDKHSWRNRNKIKTSQGAQWLTVPVNVDSKTIIKDVNINNSQNWQRKHIKAVKQNYSKALFFERYFCDFQNILSKQYKYLVELDMELIYWLSEQLNIKKEIIFSSDLKIKGDRISRLIKICKKLGTNKFYEGAAGRSYIDPSDFGNEGIKVEFQNYPHPVYRQLYGQFTPYLSVIDLLFNEGENSKEILAGVENEKD